MSKGIKATLIALISAVCLVCTGICGWYYYVITYGKDKVVADTFNVGMLTASDGTQKNFIEVQYFANKDDSGLECYEIKFNSFTDETKEAFIEQGFQFIGQNGYINWSGTHTCLKKEFVDSSGFWFWREKTYSCLNNLIPNSATKSYEYVKGNDNTWVRTTREMDLDSLFRIELDIDGTNEIFGLRFKGLDTPKSESNSLGTFGTDRDYLDYFFFGDVEHDCYYMYDVQYFMGLILQSVRDSLVAGINEDFKLPFADLFNYYTYKGNGNYELINTDFELDGNKISVEKLQILTQSFYQIRIKTYEYGLQRASDSMFGSVLGNANYNTTGTYASDDYFIGKTVIDCDVYSFDFINDGANNITLTLKSDFIAYYDRFKNSIILNIEIDTDLLESLGYDFVGFAEDGLADFKVLRCVKISGDTTEEVSV